MQLNKKRGQAANVAGDIVLNNWKLIQLIGEGSFGCVFEAERDDFDITPRPHLNA